MSPQGFFLVLNAPPLRLADGRLLESVRAMEEILSGERMRFEILDSGALAPIKDLKTFFESALTEMRFPPVCNGSEQRYVGFNVYPIQPSAGPGGTPLVRVEIETPRDDFYEQRIESLLSELGEGLNAYWGVATPQPSASIIGSQVVSSSIPARLRLAPALGLPFLRPFFELSSVETPQFLGWVNYWSRRTTKELGFLAEQPELHWKFHRTWQTRTEATMITLTKDPLSLGLSGEHLRVLKAAYERFPEIGGRASR